MNETESPKKRLFTGMRIALLFVLLIGAFIGYTRYFMTQRAASNQQVYDNLSVFGDRLENLEKSTLHHEERIKELEETVHKLSSAPPPAAPVMAASAPTPAAPDSTAGAAPVSDERIAALEKEIAALKAAAPMQSADNVNQAIKLLSAFHRLSDKVLSGKPFAIELTAFDDLAKPDESSGSPLSSLAPYAESGIPTFATLLASFDQSVDGLDAALAVPPADAGFWDRFKYNMAHLVSVRRIDDAQTGNSERAIVGRAQAHLEREEIEAAMTEIKSLPESTRGNFAAWLDDAQMVTEAPSLVDQIEEQVMQKAFHAEPAAKPADSTPTPQTPKS